MKKFEFRLESVLGYREQVEKQRQVALAKIQHLVVEHEQKLLQAYSILEKAREDLRGEERVGGCVDVRTVRQQRVHIGTLKSRVSDLLKQLRKLERELAHQRDTVIQARKERKVLELLKDRRHVEYVKEADRVEQAELDDIAGKAEVLKRSQS
jgi:flagellar FliJ protein